MSGSVASAQITGPTIKVGAGETGYAVNLFGPNEVIVAENTTVSFAPTWGEPHTVSFPATGKQLPPPSDPNAAVPTNPGQVVAVDGSALVSSGFIFPGDTYQVTFTKQGAYPFACIIHPGMSGTVKVVAPGVTVSTQAALDAAATKTFADALTAMKAEAAKLAAKAVTKVANSDGSSTWRVETVGGLVGPSDLQQFFPNSLDIKAGDTVVWESTIETPHTVSFLGGEDPSKLFADGGPDPLGNPKIFLPVPAPAAGYNGVGYANSGVIGEGWPSGHSFSLKFTTAGSFPYACILHVDQGMAGVIKVSQVTQTPSVTVTPIPGSTTTAAPAPPKTGNAGLGDSESPYLAIMLVAFGATMLIGVRIVTGRWR